MSRSNCKLIIVIVSSQIEDKSILQNMSEQLDEEEEQDLIIRSTENSEACDDDPKGFPCPQCRRIFSNKYKRDRHQRIHSGVKPYRCPHCPYRSTRKDPVLRHIKKRHSTNSGKDRISESEHLSNDSESTLHDSFSMDSHKLDLSCSNNETHVTNAEAHHSGMSSAHSQCLNPAEPSHTHNTSPELSKRATDVLEAQYVHQQLTQQLHQYAPSIAAGSTNQHQGIPSGSANQQQHQSLNPSAASNNQQQQQLQILDPHSVRSSAEIVDLTHHTAHTHHQIHHSIGSPHPQPYMQFP